ncbi:DUF805 domain-containing protein [Massilia sp. CCM 8734]|uniref:DUF805 domain-containing protein n=1 Tax=Massilia sp. CCM 8734 TaxID=2609283 RepID=UPI00142216B0|nr:DUF805 domain-containing protein [Massilia sp. CCM 8734]NHZ95879.1 DUF805 domain-containing protein [Massilia sp. CCM 8734]
MDNPNPYAAPASDLNPVRDPRASYTPTPFSLDGRIGRLRYLVYGFLPGVLLLMLVAYLIGPLGLVERRAVAQLLALAGALAALALALAMTRRRLHDLARPGWWALLMLLPPVNLLALGYLLYRAGDAGGNRYGPPPSENTTLVAAGVWSMLLLGVTAIVAQFDVG